MESTRDARGGGWLRGGRRPPALVGVVHIAPTPGAPRADGDVERLLERARTDARAYVAGGADALLVENLGDAPFFAERVPPETVATLALAVAAVRAEAGGRDVGVNVLRNDARSAVGICAAAGARFLRVNVHVGAMLTDQGLVQGRAAETLRERARLAPRALLLADVHVKHATPLAPADLADAAEETVTRGLADAVIVSGTRTGSPPARGDLERVRERLAGTPLFVGSGLDEENARELLGAADGAIVGTACKAGGRVEAEVDPERVRRLRALFDACG